MEKYTTYENKPNKRVCIHKNPCNQIRKNGGEGQGLYKEFFTFEDAEKCADSLVVLGYKKTLCQDCSEHPKSL